jgi:hypothetical protein
MTQHNAIEKHLKIYPLQTLPEPGMAHPNKKKIIFFSKNYLIKIKCWIVEVVVNSRRIRCTFGMAHLPANFV